MQFETLLIYIIIPIVTAMVSFIIRTLLLRIEKLEMRTRNVLDNVETRQLVADKLDPLREDIKEIKDKVDKLFDLYITNKYKGNGHGF